MENPDELSCQLIQKGVAQDLNGNNQEKLPPSISTGYSGSESLSSEVGSDLINSQSTSLGFSEDYSSSISSTDHAFISTMVSHFVLPAMSQKIDLNFDSLNNPDGTESNDIKILSEDSVSVSYESDTKVENPDVEASNESQISTEKHFELAVEVYHSDSEINTNEKNGTEIRSSSETSSSSGSSSPEPQSTLSKWSSQQKLIIVVDENQKKDPATQITTASDTNTTIITISTTSTTTTMTSQMSTIRPENPNDEVTITSNSNSSKFVSRVDIDTDKSGDEGKTEMDEGSEKVADKSETENEESGKVPSGHQDDAKASNSEPSFAQSLLQYFISCIPCNKTIK